MAICKLCQEWIVVTAKARKGASNGQREAWTNPVADGVIRPWLGTYTNGLHEDRREA